MDKENKLEMSSLRKLMQDNFLEFASYVIKERAIPYLDDGLKPVQRRILYTLKRFDDSRFHKVANLVGSCMQFHPHGDASIYSALVNLANKNFFIEKQGNFGNIFTGDPAAAARYIEARLTPLARKTLFNDEITQFVDSYDGRNQEPITLPAKLPILLMSGTDGIAVGMSTKVLPHNFIELIQAQIKLIRNQGIELFPDFPQGGIADVNSYNQGNGKIIVRAKIEKLNNKTLIIKEIPYGTTTELLISSIEQANKLGKIKLNTITDYTSENVEIELKVARGVDIEQTLKALYAFTDCEMSFISSIIVINKSTPIQVSVGELLYKNTENLMRYLTWELAISLAKKKQKLHMRTLERIFIEEKIYTLVEQCKSQKELFVVLYQGLEKFKEEIPFQVSDEDIENLLKIPIRRISSFDREKNKEEIKIILKEINDTIANLKNLKSYAINFLKNLIKDYKNQYPRKTLINKIEKINVKKVALSNLKLGIDKKKGYVGFGIKITDFIACNEFDRFIIVSHKGEFKVFSSLDSKQFVGRFFKVFKLSKDLVYKIVYTNKKTNFSYIKKCKINSFILDKEYNLIPPDCKIIFMDTAVGVELKAELDVSARVKENTVHINFEEIPIRTTSARGFKITQYPIKKLLKVKKGSKKTEADKQELEDTDENVEKKNLWRPKEPLPCNSEFYLTDFFTLYPKWKKLVEREKNKNQIPKKIKENNTKIKENNSEVFVETRKKRKNTNSSSQQGELNF